jgi:hypothetical protein
MQPLPLWCTRTAHGADVDYKITPKFGAFLKPRSCVYVGTSNRPEIKQSVKQAEPAQMPGNAGPHVQTTCFNRVGVPVLGHGTGEPL